MQASRNSYYYMVRRTKYKGWKDLLQRVNEIYEAVAKWLAPEAQVRRNSRQLDNTERCWTAPKYTIPWISSPTPDLSDANMNYAIMLEEKRR